MGNRIGPSRLAAAAMKPERLDSWRRATRAVPRRPQPRWRFDDAVRGRYDPFAAGREMLLALAAAGAPEPDVLAPVEQLAAELRARYPAEEPSVAECVRQETHAQGALDEAEVGLLVDGSPAALARADERAAEHETWLRRLRRRLQRDRETAGWASRSGPRAA